MKLNDKLNELFTNAINDIRNSDKYQNYRTQFENELIARCSKGDTTPFQIANIDSNIRTVLVQDLRNEGLNVTVINGHIIEASINITKLAA